MSSPSSSKALRTILMATDLSTSSRHAAERAALLAQASDAGLSFVHVVSGSALDGLRRLLGAQANAEEGLLKAARHELHQLAWPIAQRRGLEIAELLVNGAVVEEIVAAARRAVADLVVVGAHSAESVVERWLGSTTARLLRTARCPVIVSRQERPEPYRRVLVPLDFSPWTASTIELAREVAPGAHLVLMHAWELPFEGLLRRADIDAAQVEQYQRDFESEVRGRMARVAEDHKLLAGGWTAVAAHGHVRSRIPEAQRGHHCDLIAIGKHGRHFSEELLLGSVTQMVVEASHCDVLVSTGRDRS